jgi:mono/diheme cytochrome c family protein
MKYLFLFLLFSCNTPTPDNRGETLYKAKCLSCHNANPTQAGALGPEIAESSYGLIKEKTQNRSYPEGYIPKRKTNIMPKIVLSDGDIEKLQKYLSSFKK